MMGFGVLLICVSWINLAIVLKEPFLKAVAEGVGIQMSLTIVSIILYAISSIIPYFGNVALMILAILGSYYFPQMTVTFMCTAFGICFMLFSVSEPDKNKK